MLASQLNEMEEGVAPTDSRLRSDQRLMEFGLWDEANIEKLRLEEMQRVRNRKSGAADSNQINENGIIIYKYFYYSFCKEAIILFYGFFLPKISCQCFICISCLFENSLIFFFF